ncbi:hypothetical protein PR202_gb27429 [Eleusine coracana subsp. coracana]|uniref:Glycosyltransferase family 28 N-terminal domain-containing protein n=1 Tax=Eleusine coracana subsp. coracana TaxID=191504 RepID=A0AAV5FUE0_ELECO|nr:hypothetical protein PR202_gb27429 [Eleusine coracana subsp. coracana]
MAAEESGARDVAGGEEAPAAADAANGNRSEDTTPTADAPAAVPSSSAAGDLFRLYLPPFPLPEWLTSPSDSCWNCGRVAMLVYCCLTTILSLSLPGVWLSRVSSGKLVLGYVDDRSLPRSSTMPGLKMLNRIATVKDDGTVVVDVPSGLEPATTGVGTEDGYGEVAIEESLDGTDIPYRPPMQIVILIVGTRGDVQPFVAIGKRLQVSHRPTSEFPHPLSRVKQSAGYRLSYQIVDSMIWLGIRDMINEFRKKKLKLRPVTYLSGSQGSGNDIPHGYIWSPHLVPKPKDWGPKIDVVGFCFLDLASNYVPPEPLVKWLEAGDKPIYIGFGSLWKNEQKDFVYLLDNCPHDWLFSALQGCGASWWSRIRLAGCSAAGLKAACPTTIVPFFGDQPFWGDRVHARGLGPAPIPVDQFGLQKLVDAIKFMMEPEVRSANFHGHKWFPCIFRWKEKAVEIAKAMESEDGVTGAVRAFLRHLPSKTEEKIQPQSSSFLEFLGPMSRCLGCS